MDNNIKQNENALFSDENCEYYKFSMGAIAKYDKEKHLYYTLNKENEWVVNGNVLPWLIGSDYDYDVIDVKGEGKHDIYK